MTFCHYTYFYHVSILFMDSKQKSFVQELICVMHKVRIHIIQPSCIQIKWCPVQLKKYISASFIFLPFTRSKYQRRSLHYPSSIHLYDMQQLRCQNPKTKLQLVYVWIVFVDFINCSRPVVGSYELLQWHSNQQHYLCDAFSFCKIDWATCTECYC